MRERDGVIDGDGPEAVVFRCWGGRGVDVDGEAVVGELALEVGEEGGAGWVSGVSGAEEDGEGETEEEVGGCRGRCWCWMVVAVGGEVGRDAVAGGGSGGIDGHHVDDVHSS